MANRYWVGGTGDWNSANTANWSSTSGGSGGASVPTSSDDVFFDSNSGGGDVGIGGQVVFGDVFAGSLTINNFAGTFITYGYDVRVSGAATISSSGGNVSGLRIEFNSGGGSFNPNGRAIDRVTVSHTSGVVTLPSSLTAGLILLYPGGTGSISRPSSGTFTGTGGIQVDWSSSGGFGPSLSLSANNYVLLTARNGITLSFGSVSKLGRAEGVGTGSISISTTSSYSESGVNLKVVDGSVSLGSAPSSITSSSVSVERTGTGSFSGVASTIVSRSVNISGTGLPSFAVSTPAFTSGILSLGSNTAISSYNCSLSVYTSISSDVGASIGTLTCNNNSATLSLGSDLNTNTLSLSGASSSSKLKVQSDSTGVQRKLQASSFTLSNIYWKDIDADGTIPFTGTGFEDGGNNLDIQFLLPINGLFFGSNF